MTAVDPRAWFPNFYTNPAIRALGTASRWTISGQLGDHDPHEDQDIKRRKAPIDVQHLIRGCNPGCRHNGPLRGAFALNDTCLVTLEELTQKIPGAANAAFYLQSLSDGFIVIDIEPDCPQEIAIDLLRLPDIVYSELSMSGRGFHLLAPMPENFHDFPIAAGKSKLRHKSGWYEILLDHWCTFTRNPITEQITQYVEGINRPPAISTVDELYAQLAAEARRSAGVSSSAIDTAEEPNLPYTEAIVTQILAGAKERLRSVADFDNDLSRWEFSVLGTLYGNLENAVARISQAGITYTPSDQAWLLYKAAEQVIDPRPKHKELRNGRPFLLDRAAALVAARERDS